MLVTTFSQVPLRDKVAVVFDFGTSPVIEAREKLIKAPFHSDNRDARAMKQIEKIALEAAHRNLCRGPEVSSMPSNVRNRGSNCTLKG